MIQLPSLSNPYKGRIFFAISDILKKGMRVKEICLILGLSVLIGCSGLETSEEKKIRTQNLVIAPIQRQSNEKRFAPPSLSLKNRPPYPWEKKWVGGHLRITKEFFYCRGNRLNPPIRILREKDFIYHLDCGGIETHSLPMRKGKEFIYPILIDLLNHLQEKLKRRVVITCGHRCPTHNLYCDVSKHGQTSKHLIGAEVDFYVEGLESEPQKVLNALFSYYKKPMSQAPLFADVPTPSWHNQEVAITLFHPTEGRDFDNDHPYPYISIQVRYDRDTKRSVHYHWHQAHHGYLKHSFH